MIIYYKNHSERMPGHEAIGSYNWIKISKLKKPWIQYMGVPKFRQDWALLIISPGLESQHSGR